MRIAHLRGCRVAGDVVRLDAQTHGEAIRVFRRERADLRRIGRGRIRREVALDDVGQTGMGRESDFVESAVDRRANHRFGVVMPVAPGRVLVVVGLHGTFSKAPHRTRSGAHPRAPTRRRGGTAQLPEPSSELNPRSILSRYFIYPALLLYTKRPGGTSGPPRRRPGVQTAAAKRASSG